MEIIIVEKRRRITHYSKVYSYTCSMDKDNAYLIIHGIEYNGEKYHLREVCELNNLIDIIVKPEVNDELY